MTVKIKEKARVKMMTQGTVKMKVKVCTIRMDGSDGWIGWLDQMDGSDGRIRWMDRMSGSDG